MSRPRKLTSAEPLRLLAEDHNWTNGQTAEALGLSESAIRSYLRDGLMPITVAMAVDAISLRERAKEEAPEVLVLIGPEAELEKIRAVADVMSLRTARLTDS